MAPIQLVCLNGPHIAALAMTDGEILEAVEGGLRAQGHGETVIEPRVHLVPDPAFHGHFNVLRGYVAPLHVAGVRSAVTRLAAAGSAALRPRTQGGGPEAPEGGRRPRVPRRA